MRVLSWDVGIKNLAYCLIENYKIVDWGIINLLEDNLKCHGFISSDNSTSDCCKEVKYEYNQYKFCLLHKNQFLKLDSNILNEESYRGLVRCTCIKSDKKVCNKESKFKIGSNYYCKLHYNNFIKNNNVLRKVTKVNASKAPIDEIKMNLITELDKKTFENIDYVVIENQPSIKNPKMKSVAETLYSWFLIRGIVDKEITNLKNIHYLSPSNKLKINDVDLNKEIDKLHDKSKKYKLTKESSIIYTNKLLTNNKENNWIDYLQKSKKKDDLCDCYLQGIYFINSKN